jgi:hypothetical protein
MKSWLKKVIKKIVLKSGKVKYKLEKNNCFI